MPHDFLLCSLDSNICQDSVSFTDEISYWADSFDNIFLEAFTEKGKKWSLVLILKRLTSPCAPAETPQSLAIKNSSHRDVCKRTGSVLSTITSVQIHTSLNKSVTFPQVFQSILGFGYSKSKEMKSSANTSALPFFSREHVKWEGSPGEQQSGHSTSHIILSHTSFCKDLSSILKIPKIFAVFHVIFH